MSDKGGKRFSLPTKTTTKSSLKSASAAKHGKDDDSAKSKRGRKVQFGTQASPDLNANFSSPTADANFTTPMATGKGKGDWAKGGKGEKIVNAGKTSLPKEAKSLELRVEHELPDNVKCLMDCEAANILEGIQEQMVILSEDSTIKLPESFDMGLQYAKTGSYYTNPQSVKQVLDQNLGALTKYGVTYSEICVIGNVCPETAEEVFALVRSLEAKRSRLSEPLKDVLDELAKLKTCS